MENRSDIEKRLGEKLEAAYMLEEIPQGMSREDFHRLIQAAEKKKKRRRNMLSLAAACVALCLVCGGFVAGMTLGESATAGNDGEKKTVQQGDSVVIGSGVGENDENVGVSTKTYTSIEDIPEDIRKEIHFLDSDEFELEKVKVVLIGRTKTIKSFYWNENNEIEVEQISMTNEKGSETIVMGRTGEWREYHGRSIYCKNMDGNMFYSWIEGGMVLNVKVYCSDKMTKIETILDGLYVIKTD